MLTEKHDHKFELKIKRIRAENTEYKGSTGDKAYIFWGCKCGEETAIDMGATSVMAARFKELKLAQKSKKPAKPRQLSVS